MNIHILLPYIFPAASVTAVMASVFLLSRYRTPLAGWGGAFMLAMSLLMASYYLVLTSTTPSFVQFGFRLQVISYSSVSFSWLFLVFVFTRHAHWINLRTVVLWAMIPALTVGAALAQPELGTRWISSGGEIVGSYIGLTQDLGWLGYLFIAYEFGVGFITLGLLLGLMPNTDGNFQVMARTLCGGLSLTLLAMTLEVAGIYPFPPIPNMQIGFAIDSLFSFFIVYALRAGGTLPIGRAMVFEYIQDAVLVLDHNDAVVDINPSAEQIIGHKKMDALGKPIIRIWPQAAQFLPGQTEDIFSEGEHSFLVKDLELTFDIKISPVVETVSQERIGRVVVLRNVTGRELMEKALQESTRDLRRTNKLITALSIVASHLGSAADSKLLLDSLGRELRNLDLQCAVLAFDTAGETATINYVSFEPALIRAFERMTGISTRNYIVPKHYWPWDRVLKERIPVWHPNPQEFIRRMFPQISDGIAAKAGQLMGIQSMGQICILPLIIEERVVGAMPIWGADLQPADTPTLALFASQVAAILQNANALERESRRANELARSNAMILALSKVAAQVDSTSDFAAIMDTVGTELKKIGAECAMGTLDESKQILTIEYLSINQEEIRMVEQLVGFSLNKMAVPRQVWLMEKNNLEKNTHWDPVLLPGSMALFPQIPDGIRGRIMELVGINFNDPVCYLPLEHEEEVIGVLIVWGSRLQREDIPALCVFANQVANVILNRRLYELAQAEIVERAHAQERLAYNAFHDLLTDLPNRMLFVDRVSQRMERFKRHPQDLFAVLFIDLDRFKDVNDGLGHLVGDQLLIAVSQRLKHCMRPEDTVSRLGGDEFGILINDIEDVSDVLRIAERIKIRLMSTSLLVDVKRATTVSIGIAISNTGYTKPFELLRDADTAMYRAKSAGGNQHQLFDAAMYSQVIQLLEMEGELKRAVDRQEWQVQYQPILSIAGGKIAGVEALVRWAHPQRGIISPLEFIKLAEDTGLIVPIGEYVLRTACAQVKNWRDHGHPELWVSVNLSGRQFQDQYLLRMIENILTYTGLAGDGLRIEVTESVAMRDLEHTARVLNALSDIGIQVSLDDFGTGYSSLSYLNQFPINVLKIDRSFIKDLEINENNKAITSAIISMGHSLNLEVVAEGVETEDQLTILRSQFCDKVQGFLFSRPQSSQALTEWLQNTAELI